MLKTNEYPKSCEGCQVWTNELCGRKNDLILYKGVYVYPCEVCGKE